MDEHHCLQLAEESYLIVFPVKFRDITAFDSGGKRLLRFEKLWFHSLICSLYPVRLLWWKGSRKENHATTVVCKQTNLIVQRGTRFSSPRNIFPRLVSVSIHVSRYTTAARSVLPFITAVAQKGFLALVKIFLDPMHSYHFSCSSKRKQSRLPCAGH